MAPGGRQGILSLTIKDKNALYAAYMQFVKNGGLFIPTNKKYKIGDEGNKAAGVGVQFSEQDGGMTRNKIEGYLAGALKSERPTHTM
ncbi:MAG: pilus assembly protein PilZ [Candidatus Sedimenticola endophacoides]|uniref:Pilus assembly protein PilZ n=1 Tax=Candidatus Sedimenticola endophacoides TaxID=2548426 RepID=A0A657PZX2_9GAMM|nr:MAG: pilus assembly protein PilZ [Candidatus Sedimenticola endophacoides]OQX38891.1 MAG: pilus assembly protein PilZ [Candidatus Sedimenticola endophacoides]OQX46675.1 MAG: pilus assembly protein PilZ [Candidatus Sedimenticola endophacoides]OQX46796.1 MAG: pilus assembly protein PilZ [Candidatus Sedimenticola endophacoides]